MADRRIIQVQGARQNKASAEAPAAGVREIAPDIEERLRALGYVAGDP